MGYEENLTLIFLGLWTDKIHAAPHPTAEWCPARRMWIPGVPSFLIRPTWLQNSDVTRKVQGV